MAKTSFFAMQQAALQKEYFRTGERTGEQFASDCYQRAMLEAGISKPKIREIGEIAQRVINESADMFAVKDAEADYKQEVFDRPLREIWGDAYTPFEIRYEYMKMPRY